MHFNGVISYIFTIHVICLFLTASLTDLKNVHFHDTNTEQFGSHNKICSHIFSSAIKVFYIIDSFT